MTKQRDLFSVDPDPWDLDESDDCRLARVVFSEAMEGEFDYEVPAALASAVRPGQRIRVPLGRGNRLVTAYCVGVEVGLTEEQRRNPIYHRLKPVHSVLDPEPLLSPRMLELTRWIADYYLCSWGQALESALPASVRGQAGTREVAFFQVPTRVAAKLTQLDLPKKQQHALETLAGSSSPLSLQDWASLAGCSTGPLKSLEKKGLVAVRHQRVHVDPPRETEAERQAPLQLNPFQQKALEAIVEPMRKSEHRVVLVHGVTGSGKTEVYIQAIEEVIRFGRQAIVLVPEISLTPQTRQRFRSRFANVAVLHSHLSDAERNWHWKRIARGEIQVVVGARSAVFAPTPHLGLIVLDEEHDASFKQDSVPRYHARDVARRRAAMENIPLVLGSATPALESWKAAKLDTWHWVDLPNRVLDRPLPAVASIDLRAEFHDRRHRGAISRPLAMAIRQTLEEQGQVILLLNRRGFATNIQCPACGHVVECPHCDISLTHHREESVVVCHYCDYQRPSPAVCPECQFDGIRFSGLGTQKLEAEVKGRFPRARCLRMDSDTMQRPGSHEEAFARFRAGEVQILLGTQMIAKGLDFPNVTLVGVINADTALHFPDFRAAERTFQLVTQVAGRTGRGDRGGRVLVQTFSPEHEAIAAALQHDYPRFAEREVQNRKEFGYPPFSSLVRIIFRGEATVLTEQLAEQVTEALREAADKQQLATRILGPAPAPIAKLRGKYRFHTMLFTTEPEPLRAILREVLANITPPTSVQWAVDVDPVNML